MQEKLSEWELLFKKILWQQLGDINNKKILDYGSGLGITANYYAKDNEVIAIEPSRDSVNDRWMQNNYMQITGDIDELYKLKEESFDIIFCHNVLEYADEREDIVREFARILKPDGIISIVKHNRPGRVMQMTVLLNDFESANALLDGQDGMTSKFGAIHYYEDTDLEKWCSQLSITRSYGIRTFWDLQQNQDIQKDTAWQEKMIQLEMRVSEIEGYQNVAFFHHLILKKNGEKTE